VGDSAKLVTDMGLASINLIGVVIALLVGVGLVTKEIERKTIYTILARPISRAQFIIGKYFGLVSTLGVNVALMTTVFVSILFAIHAPVSLAIFQAIQLMFVELLLVTAVAMFFSTFSTTGISTMVTLGIYVIGHMSADLKGIAEKGHSESVKVMMAGLYYLCPNLDILNIKGQAARGVLVSGVYQLSATLYGLFFASVLVLAACVVFHRRDF
jgi:hypothetical protein